MSTLDFKFYRYSCPFFYDCVFVHAGAWLKSGWGHVRQEGNQLILTYIAPQLGYWLAAMSPLHAGDKLPDYLLIKNI